ncbi:MAG: hypothetical protein MAG453_00986 [Calditrichaeota bacterium]|nr:hypothetical protein [Calditrichota bacterium]
MDFFLTVAIIILLLALLRVVTRFRKALSARSTLRDREISACRNSIEWLRDERARADGEAERELRSEVEDELERRERFLVTLENHPELPAEEIDQERARHLRWLERYTSGGTGE